MYGLAVKKGASNGSIFTTVSWFKTRPSAGSPMLVQAAAAIVSVNPLPQTVAQTSLTQISSRPLLGLNPSLSLRVPSVQGRAIERGQGGGGRRRGSIKPS